VCVRVCMSERECEGERICNARAHIRTCKVFVFVSVFSQTYVLLIPLLFSMLFIFLPHRKCAQITDISQLTLSVDGVM
jgi:hypothetical protein